MPSVTHDSRSFLIDGRRIWLVGARVPYARLPREVWAERIHAAKQAGFNTIEAPVFWNRHEPRAGRFDFTGENDLRHFVDLIGKAGMYCILGVGPYVGSAWDMGGLPSWLIEQSSGRLRTTGGAFLEATSRFITALADQIRGWQVTAAGSGGPIVLLQCENEWTCGQEELASSYLGELNRYIRESGLTVPLINDNQLWASVEGQIDGWSDSENPLEQIRQLAVVRPEQPRFVVDLLSYEPDTWGKPTTQGVAPWAALRRAAEVLAGGGQFTVQSFCAGINMGFTGGRIASDPQSFVTAQSDPHSLVSETGQPQEAYHAIRRLATFATKFGRIFANLDPQYRPVSLAPQSETSLGTKGDAEGKKGKGADSRGRGGCSVVHCVGSQGSIVFLFGDEPQGSSGKSKPQRVELMLADGWTLPVTLPPEGVAWCLFDVNINGRCRVDYCNVSPLGVVDHTLVCFGPAGSRAMISINGAPIEIDIEEDKPSVVEHEGLTLVIISQEEADTTYFREDGVAVGVAGLGPDSSVIPLAGSKSYLFVGADGKKRVVPVEAVKKSGDKHPAAPALNHWTHASMQDYIDGSNARYAKIAVPTDLTKLGTAFGYGWYKISFEASGTSRIKTLYPFSGDRVHVYLGGEFCGVAGVAPGAGMEVPLAIKKGPQSIVMLADNLGRFCEGVNLGESKGVYGPVYAVAPVKVGTPKIMSGDPIEPLAFKSPLWEVRAGDTTHSDRLTWTIQHKRKTPLIVHIPHPPASALMLLNDAPVAYIDSSGPTRVVFDPEDLERGVAVIQFALVNAADPDAELQELGNAGIHVWEGIEALSDETEISFAKWEAPTASMFGPMPKKAPKLEPAWWRTTFTLEKTGSHFYFDATGLTKGQLYVNGRHLCRYWVATHDGKPVPPQSKYYIPAAWLVAGVNEITLFDEHGALPSKCKLTNGA